MPTDHLHLSDLAEARRLAEAATPEPWDSIVSRDAVRYLGRPQGDHEHGDFVCHTYRHYNAEFIAYARTAVPSMADEIEHLRRMLLRWGEHDEDCKFFSPDESGGKCDCGWDELKASIEQAVSRDTKGEAT